MLAAAGSAPHNGGFAAVDASRVTLSYNGTMVLERGAPLRRRAGRLERDAAGSSSTSASATGAASYLTSDLSYDYVRINADYRT